MNDKINMREFSCYIFLSVLGMLGVSCYILADTFFVSKGLGTNGLAALNIAIPVYNFIHGTGLMLGMGGATKFSVYKSQNRIREIDQIYTNTVYAAIAFAAVFFLTGIFFSEHLAVLLGADSYTMEMTETYLKWLLLFGPAFLFNDVLLCFLRNDNQPQLTMKAQLIGSFSNIVLDYIFIFPMQMGMFGAIFATGLSPVISILIMLPHCLKKKQMFHFIRCKMKADMIGQTLSLGFPSLLAQLSSGIVMIIFNSIILRLEGNTGVAAYGVIANISLVIVAIYTGIAQGSQPLISRYYGEGKKALVKQTLRYALALILVLSVLLYAVIFLFAQPLTLIFNSEKNAVLQQIAVTGLKIYFTSNIVVGYNIMLATFFTSIERAVPAQILSILRGFVLIIAAAFLLSSIWQMTGVWLAYPVTEFLVAILGMALYRAKIK